MPAKINLTALEREQLSDDLLKNNLDEELEKTALEREKELTAQAHELTRTKWWNNANLICGFWMRILASVIIPFGVIWWVWSVFNFIKDCSLIEGSHYCASDKVLVALVGGTSASVLTLLILIVKHLFPGNKR